MVDFNKILKQKGALVLKEPVLDNVDEQPMLCSSGQGMRIRQMYKIEEWLSKIFYVVR